MKESKSSGIGFVSALGLLFIGLKLGNVITWSWWWVLLPLYIGPVILLLVVLGWLIWQIATNWGRPNITSRSKLANHIANLKRGLFK